LVESCDDSHVPFDGPLDDGVGTEQANHCFGCGPDNPQGLRLEFTLASSEAGGLTASAEVKLTRLYEGPPGHIHGGIIATLLDEAMSKLNRPLNIVAMTRSLTVDYLRPAPLETTLKLVATHIKKNGRKVLHAADLMLEDGTMLAHGEGFFLVIPPQMIENAKARTP
jgi:uncharacterized protein (TIGR00369 family)